ncbi:MAG: PIG-L family deacetylase [Candidatus Gottesmanbacteria bacterium]
MKTMLIVFAHPDDESFGTGGTIAKYAGLGWKIDLIVATNGEKGQNGTFTWAHDDALADLRKKELEAAANILGIRNITYLAQSDGGLSTLSPGTIEDPIYKKMIELLPDIVITHDTMGISNHPDHIKVCFATTFAFQKYVEHIEELKHPEDFKPGRGKVWKEAAHLQMFGELDPESKEPKLYYTCMPEHVASYLKKMKIIPEQSFDKPWIGTKDKLVTTTIAIEGTKVKKGKALLCHETQQADTDRFIDFDNHPLHTQEHFILRMQGIHEVFMGKTDRVAETL